MEVRLAEEADFAAIDNILRAAFETDAEARLTTALRAAGNAKYEFVVQEKGVVIGCIMLSPLETPQNCLGLGPVAVTPDRQNEGMGNALVKHAIEAARTGGWQAIFLLGSPKYYSRFGFSVSDAAPFKSDYPPEYMQALALTEHGFDVLEQRMIYAAPFREL